ncbi:MAG: hypothetical protein AAF368_10630 [Planctomycetota bacterium]
MTDPNSNDPQVPETPRDPQAQPPKPEPESTRTEPYDPSREEGPTVDAEARGQRYTVDSATMCIVG